MVRITPKAPSYWFDGTPIPRWARLVEPIYAIVSRIRRALLRHTLSARSTFPVPVIVVGNLIAGGAGKTPVTIAIASYLRSQGWLPGVASRGYGRQHAQTPRWVDAQTSPQLGGDEAVLIAWKTKVPVRVDVKRVAACHALVAAGCNVIICDDGLQHYQLARDIEIEVIDGLRRYGNGRLLPAGPLREPTHRADSCDFRIVTTGTHNPTATAQHTALRYREWEMQWMITSAIPLYGLRVKPRLLASFAGQRVHAVAGIAHPERFFAMLRGFGLALIPHVFPDHHRFCAADLQFASRLPILMTEKDAVKCKDFADEWCYAVPLDTQLPHAFWVVLLDRLNTLGRFASTQTR